MFAFETNFFRDPSYRFNRAVALEHTFSKQARKWILLFSEILLGGSVILFFLDILQKKFVFTWFVASADLTASLFFLGFSLWLSVKMLNFYFNSYYFYTEGLLERGKTGAQTSFTTPNYEVTDICYTTKNGDILKEFCSSKYGAQIFLRIGIEKNLVNEFLAKRINPIRYRGKESELLEVHTLLEMASFLFKNDQEFRKFFFKNDIKEEEFLGSVAWVERIIKAKRQREHVWGKINLSKIPPIGEDFSYGGAYLLRKYSNDISNSVERGVESFQFVYGSEEIKQLQTILSRSSEANAMLVGEEGIGAREIILDFARDITNEYVGSALKNKRVLSLDTKIILATMSTKQDLEILMLKIMNDAVSAGNVILVVEDLPLFIRGCGLVGSDIMSLIDPYLSARHIQFIGTASTEEFYKSIESNSAVMKRFEAVILKEPAKASLVRVIEKKAEEKELENRIYFTYQSVVEIINSAENYFDNAVMPDKAIDLLTEIAASMVASQNTVVTKADVLKLVSSKTNIPLGLIGEDEKNRLDNLEPALKELVVGQEEALSVIANAMRRSRAGVRNLNRPIGSFLFLGPTGVGKTETAKALAAVYFGNKDAMSRLDMTEYQDEDGLSRLIGAGNTVGTLSTMLKSQPYGVFLLDEFEKANPKVLDLFLQLLDEGVIHNADGKKINGRNSIFIATSNAGADKIRATMKNGINLEDAKKDIIDAIIASGVMRPELINRFDGVILFHSLGEEHYKKIAILMLGKLKKRVFEKNINLVINDALIDTVMRHGIDPDFGARPMARAIQDIIEQKIANKIIAGEVRAGDTLEFAKEDFSANHSPLNP